MRQLALLSLCCLSLLTPACSDDGDPTGPDAATTDGSSTLEAAVDQAPAPDSKTTLAWHEIKPAATPGGRAVHLLAYDPDSNRVLLVAGQPNASKVPLGDIWSYDGNTWTELKPKTPLPARKNFGLAYDTARKRLVVFGGIHGGLYAPQTYLNDTWEFDGTDWTEIKPATSPPVRAGHAMAFDAARGRAVVFGGGGGTTDLDDTWEWDGAAWKQITPSTKKPQGRFNTRMVYDPGAKRVLLFGGQDAGGADLGDLWAFDGQNWTELWPSSKEPLGRGFFSLAFDPTRSKLVLHGGTVEWPPNITAANTFAEHWEWDGKAWTKVGDGKAPGKSAGGAMVFDAGRGRLVMYGGGTGGLLSAETWEYY
jgi:hypothetical protein